MHAVTVTELAAILGMALGTAGFVMGLMNYLRDRPKIRVSVNWDMVEPHSGARMGIVTVTNIGRRPIFISAAALRAPRARRQFDHFLLMESIPGKKLSEGDAPAKIKVDLEGLEKYAKNWRDVRIFVEDSAGRAYFAKRLAKTRVPPWAK
jgi:hypothetical protein